MAWAPPSRPVRVSEVLVAAVPGLRERMLGEGIRSDWADIVGAELARGSRPGGLQAGVLTVTVDNSAWLHEMTLRSSHVLDGLRARCGSAVKSLRFALGEPVARTPRAAPRRPSSPAHLSAEEERSVETITASVADPELAGCLRRILGKDLIARRGRPGR